MLNYLWVMDRMAAKEMLQLVREFLDRYPRQPGARKKLLLAELKEELKSNYIDFSAYQKAGGYDRLCSIIGELQSEGRLQPIKRAPGNGRVPELRTMYWLLPPGRQPSKWSELDRIRWSDRLDVSAYSRQPSLQTDGEWARIERVYQFLRQRSDRMWATREERSLELFGDEKWLSEDQGIQFMRRVGLTLDDLLAKVYGEPFVYWPRPGIYLQQADAALIVENLSLFHTVRRVLEADGEALGLRPDLLIYGEGKKIEASLGFLADITDAEAVLVHYAGDIDPEGWGIYARLKLKYADLRIRPAVSFYEAMAGQRQSVPIRGGQTQDGAILKRIMDELQEAGGSEALLERVGECWESRVRIPQEVLTFETMRSGFRNRSVDGG